MIRFSPAMILFLGIWLRLHAGSINMRLPSESTLHEGDTHVYTMALTTGTSVKIHFDQRSVFLLIRVFDPNQGVVAQVAPYLEGRGSLMVGFEAVESGVYTIQVEPMGFFDPDNVNTDRLLPYHEKSGHYLAELVFRHSFVEKMVWRYTQEHEPRVVWSRQNIPAISLDHKNHDFTDLEPLKEAIGDARMVILGESNHLDGGAIYGRARLVAFLYQEMGFRVLATESGLFDGDWLWNNIKNGTATELGWYKGIKDFWSGAKEFDPTRNILETRAQTDDPLIFAGFDPWIFVIGFLDELRAFIKENQLEMPDEQWFGIATHVIKENYRLEREPVLPEKQRRLFAKRLDRLIDEAMQLGENQSQKDRWLRYLCGFRVMVDQFLVTNTERVAILDPQERDRIMGDNLIWMAREKFKDKKIIVWAHNFHTSRYLSKAMWPNHQKPLSTLKTMTQHLDEALGDQVYTLGFTNGHGSTGWTFYHDKVSHDWLTRVIQADQTPALELEEIMTLAGFENAFIDLRNPPPGGEWLQSPFYSRVLANTTLLAPWSNMIDGIIFMDEGYTATYRWHKD